MNRGEVIEAICLVDTGKGPKRVDQVPQVFIRELDGKWWRVSQDSALKVKD